LSAALLTSTSRRPKREKTAPRSAATDSGSVMSAATSRMSTPWPP